MANHHRKDSEKQPVGRCVCPICEQPADVYETRRAKSCWLYWRCPCGSIQPITAAGQRFFTLPRAQLVRNGETDPRQQPLPIPAPAAVAVAVAPDAPGILPSPPTTPEPTAIDRFLYSLANRNSRA